MTVMVQIEIPREVLHAARKTSAEIQRELALHLFAEGKLSFGKARELGVTPQNNLDSLEGVHWTPSWIAELPQSCNIAP